MKKTLVVINSSFGLLYSYLIFGDQATYIVSNGVPAFLRYKFKKHIKIIYIPKFKSNILMLLYFILSSIFIIPILKLRYTEFAGHDHFFLSNLLCKKYILIEDGLGNYKDDAGFKHGFLYSFLYKKWLGVGRSDFCKKIYLTGRYKSIPLDIIRKVEICELGSLFKEKMDKLEKIFNFSSYLLNGNIKVIIYTQPLCIDGYLSIEEQYFIYKKILKKYSEIYLINEIAIKAHPRDDLDYSFLGVHILNKNIPAELLDFIIHQDVKKISLFSSSGLGDKNHQFLASEFLTNRQMKEIKLLDIFKED